MSEVTAGLPGTVGDFHGRPTRRLDNGLCWVEVLAEAGPRIVRFGLTGGESILAETPEAGWDVGYGRFELFGGHRVWFAPESDRCSVPDSTGLRLQEIEDVAPGLGIRLVGATQQQIGLRKTIELRLAPDAAALDVRHILANAGKDQLELSVWPVTQLRLGGVARAELPVPAEGHSFTPNRLLVLWPYSSYEDERLSLTDEGIEVAANPAPMLKVGCLSHAGRLTYAHEGQLFSITFDPAIEAPRPDMGCNVEIYCDEGCVELEAIGPLSQLAPGRSAVFDEHWELCRFD
jgi:hypothetical protein